MLSFFRASLALATAVTALALPAHALADPVVGAPSAASLAAGIPSFTATNDAAGFVNVVFVSPTPTLNSLGELDDASARGGGETIYDFSQTTTTASMSEPPTSGLYYFMWTWLPLNANGTTGTLQRSGLSTFTVPVQLKALKLGALYQDPKYPQAGITGTYVSNFRGKVAVSCKVMSGRKTVASKLTKIFVDTPLGTSRWECLSMRVPEAHDGKRLRLVVKLTAGRKAITRTKTFTAK